MLKLHAIYRTWQGLFPWALRCLLLSITKVHTCSSRKCIQCTRLKIPFHKFRKKLYIIYLVYLIIQVSSIFNGIYTTLLVRLFGYVTAVLLAIMNTSGPDRPLLLFVLRNYKISVFCKSSGKGFIFWGKILSDQRISIPLYAYYYYNSNPVHLACKKYVF